MNSLLAGISIAGRLFMNAGVCRTLSPVLNREAAAAYGCRLLACFAQENGLQYGFVIAAIEGPKTIPSLWPTVQNFREEHASLVPKNNLMSWVTAEDGSYNLCHFWSNFEIGNLNFFRSKAYSTFFEYLDRCVVWLAVCVSCCEAGRL